MTDVLIAGGGLVGSAVAIHLCRLGISVELFERGIADPHEDFGLMTEWGFWLENCTP